MIVLALVLLFGGMAVCSAAFLTFAVSIFRGIGLEFPLQGPLASVPSSNFVLLGWGQLAVAFGLLMASLQAFNADRKNHADDPSG
ncbi:MAG: hypothetical protein F4X65_05245 [Chloroflexi bacterium]|nr:hypothetical protein [Chloroflexota bacterium]